eukprot:Filipodium_phascolosomae@DN2708_c1_g1_i3.p1
MTAIRAHRCVLSAQSTVFERMLIESEQTEVCEVPVTVGTGAFQLFISYLYGTTVTITAQDFTEVLNLALVFKVQGLLSQLDELIHSFMSASVFASLWKLFDIATDTIQDALLDYLASSLSDNAISDVLADMSAARAKALMLQLAKVHERSMQDKKQLEKALMDKETEKVMHDEMLAMAIQDK